MDIHITDNGSGAREIWAMRDDGVTVQVVAVAGQRTLPHELFHYLVEDSLELEWGYWNCIAKGALFQGMTLRGRAMDVSIMDRASRIAEQAGTRADEAEFFVAAVESVFDAGLEGDTEAAKALVRMQWPHLTCPPLERADLVKLKQRVTDFTRHWESLPAHESLTLPWPVRS